MKKNNPTNNSKTVYFDKQVFITACKLTVIVAFVVLMLAVVNALTKDTVAANDARTGDEARRALLPQAQRFENVADFDSTSSSLGRVDAVYKAYSETGEEIGYCVDVTAMGFSSDGIGMVVATDLDGKTCLGVRITSSSETPGIGSKVVDATNASGQVDAISGATVTSKGLKNGTALALQAVETITGGQAG